MEARELKTWQWFTLSPRKNAKKFQVSTNPDAAPAIIGGPDWRGSAPDDLKGKLLIILDGCRQLQVDPETPVYSVPFQ